MVIATLRASCEFLAAILVVWTGPVLIACLTDEIDPIHMTAMGLFIMALSSIITYWYFWPDFLVGLGEEERLTAILKRRQEYLAWEIRQAARMNQRQKIANKDDAAVRIECAQQETEEAKEALHDWRLAALTKAEEDVERIQQALDIKRLTLQDRAEYCFIGNLGDRKQELLSELAELQVVQSLERQFRQAWMHLKERDEAFNEQGADF